MWWSARVPRGEWNRRPLTKENSTTYLNLVLVLVFFGDLEMSVRDSSARGESEDGQEMMVQQRRIGREAPAPKGFILRKKHASCIQSAVE